MMKIKDKFKYSVIILYWNQYEEIKLILSSLEVQDYPKEDFEIIIVDDGSEKSLESVVETFNKNINLRYIKREHCGNRSSNRNIGAQEAKGHRLIFLDGDTLPDKKMISTFSKYEDKNAVYCGYRVYLNKCDKKLISKEIIQNKFEEIAKLPGTRDGRYTPFRYFNETGQYYHGAWQILYSCCFSISKELFESLKGFDEDFGSRWGNEDIEFGYRLWKNGAKIQMLEEIWVYHLYHDVVISVKEDDFKDNSNYLLKKHQNWMMELYPIEKEIWSNEHIRIQNKIIDRCAIIEDKHSIIIEKIYNIISKRTILFGIESKKLADCKNVELLFVPEAKLKHDKIRNLIGIQLDFDENEFDRGFVSKHYVDFNEGLFTALCNEAMRVCKKVFIVDRYGNIEVFSHNSKFLLFSLSSYLYLFKEQYRFLHMMVAAKKLGYHVGLNIDIDLFQETNIDMLYLMPEKEEYQWIKAARNHTLNFVGNEINCFMDSNNFNSERSVKSRILWQEQQPFLSGNHCIKVENKFPRLLAIKKNDFADCSNKIGFLPMGIDAEKVKYYRTKSKEKNKQFRLLWASQDITKSSNLLELVRLVKGKDEIQLTIVCFDQEIYKLDNFIYTDSFNRQIRENIQNVLNNRKQYKEKIIEEITDAKNISLKKGIYKECDYLKELAKCDAYIDLDSIEEVNPLVLYSICFGKKPILLNSSTYDGYFEKNQAIYVNSKAEKNILDDIFYKPLEFNQEALEIELQKIQVTDLNNKLKKIVMGEIDIEIEEAICNDFYSKFDWKNVIKQFETIIRYES